MATLILIVIFFSFIGLGIPDSIFGPAWPAINAELNLPVSYANFVTMLISIFTVVSSILSGKIMRWLGTGLVTTISTAMTALALLGFSYANGIIFLCLLAVPLGLGAGSIDACLNNYVAVHYKASHMNFLHCFYGIGVAVSPFLMSLALSGKGGWRGGYKLVFLVQAAIAVITLAALPLWKKVKRKDGKNVEETPKERVKLKSVIKIPSLKYAWFIFFASCALEFTCGIWGSSFLIDSRGLSADKAVFAMAFYYGGIAVGRFVSGLISGKLSGWKIIFSGQTVVLAAIVLLSLPLGVYVGTGALFLIGFGNGPLFPNLTHLTPENFGKDLSPTIIGTQMAACNVGITFMPPVFGYLAQSVGMHVFPYYLAFLYVIMVLSILIFRKVNKKEKSVKTD